MLRSSLEQEVLDAAEFVHRHVSLKPGIAVILGSGLGDFAEELTSQTVLESSEVPHYPLSSVQGHAGKLFFGHIAGEGRTSPPLLVFKGRVHFYETQSVAPVIFPTLLADHLGVKILVVTNAAGGINRQFKPGDLMLIRDFLSLTFLPLPEMEGSRPTSRDKNSTFFDRSSIHQEPFDAPLQDTLRLSAREIGLNLQEGTYSWIKGPSYETAAEIEMMRRIGVDAVGMSTVPEIVTARKAGLRVLALSLISNLATGISQRKLSHSEVTETAERVKVQFASLMKEFLLHLPS